MVELHTVHIHIWCNEYFHIHSNAPIDYLRLFIQFKTTGTYYKYQNSFRTLRPRDGIYIEIHYPYNY